MPSIEEILTKSGVITEGVDMEALKKAHFAAFKSVGEVKNLTDRITTLEGEKATLEQSVKDYKDIAEKFEGEDPAAIEQMKKDFEALKQADDQRRKDEEARASLTAFEQSFNEALGEKKFANDFVRRGVMEEARKAREENAVLGLPEIIENITKDMPGCFENKQEPKPLPNPGEKPGKLRDKPAGMLDEATIRRITGLPEEVSV